jgi:hypothetical protein
MRPKELAANTYAFLRGIDLFFAFFFVYSPILSIVFPISHTGCLSILFLSTFIQQSTFLIFQNYQTNDRMQSKPDVAVDHTITPYPCEADKFSPSSAEQAIKTHILLPTEQAPAADASP